MSNPNINDIKPNSHKYKEAEKNKLKPVVNSDAIVSTKKPLSKKLSEIFLGDDTKDIKQYIIQDVIIPGVKTTILDIISMAFFNETYAGNAKRSRKTDKTSYSSYYNNSNRATPRRDRRNNSYESKGTTDYRSIILRNRQDAEELVEQMRKRIRDLGSVSIAEMYDLLDLSGTYTDNNWGWDDERDIGLNRISSGYLIDVTDAKYLN